MEVLLLFFEVFIEDSNLFCLDSNLLGGIATIFQSNHREFETALTDSNLLVRYLILSLVMMLENYNTAGISQVKVAAVDLYVFCAQRKNALENNTANENKIGQ